MSQTTSQSSSDGLAYAVRWCKALTGRAILTITRQAPSRFFERLRPVLGYVRLQPVITPTLRIRTAMIGFSKLLLWPFIYMYGAFVKVGFLSVIRCYEERDSDWTKGPSDAECPSTPSGQRIRVVAAGHIQPWIVRRQDRLQAGRRLAQRLNLVISYRAASIAAR